MPVVPAHTSPHIDLPISFCILAVSVTIRRKADSYSALPFSVSSFPDTNPSLRRSVSQPIKNFPLLPIGRPAVQNLFHYVPLQLLDGAVIALSLKSRGQTALKCSKVLERVSRSQGRLPFSPFLSLPIPLSLSLGPLVFSVFPGPSSFSSPSSFHRVGLRDVPSEIILPQSLEAKRAGRMSSGFHQQWWALVGSCWNLAEQR